MADEFQVKLTADNELSDEARDAAKALDQIPESVEVEIKADTGSTERDIDGLMSKVDRLGAGDAANLLITTNASDITNEIADLVVKLDGLDAEDPQVDVTIANIQQLTGDLDQIQAKAKELNGTPIELDTGPARSNIDELGKSAGSSKSVLANMVGNSVQDLGALGGVAGSVGVAIGQMGEYMVDAANDGDKLGAVFKNFATVAGPIAAITVIVSALGSVLGQQAAESERAAKAQEQLTAAQQKGGDEAANIADSLRDNIAALHDFDANARTGFGGFVEGVSAATEAIPLLGSLIGGAGQNITDVARAFDQAGISAYDLGKALANGGEDAEAWAIALELSGKEGKISADQASAAAQAIREYGKAAADAAASQALFNVDQEEANALLQDTVKQKEPLSQMTEVWDKLFADMADGSIDTKAAADAVNQLAKELGLTQEQVIGLAQQHLDDQMQAAADATKEAAAAAKEAADEFVKLSGAQQSINDLATSFDILSTKSGALKAIFEVGNAPLDALQAVQDVEQGIRDFGAFVKENGVPNIFDPNDVNADDFLAKIASLKGPIQQQVADAFATGGPEAAQQVATNYVDQIVASLNGKLTADEVKTLLGLDNLQAKIDVAIDQSQIATAKRALDVLTGLNGNNPLTASIALALDAGTISPEAAQILVNQQLASAGVEIPASLVVKDQGQATVEAAIFARDHPVEIPATVDTSGAETAVSDFAGKEQPTATVPVTADTAKADDKVHGVVDTAKTTKPIVSVDAATKDAVNTILLLLITAALVKPVVNVSANTATAEQQINDTARSRSTSINVGVAGVVGAESTLANLARDRTSTIRTNTIATTTLVRVDGGG